MQWHKRFESHPQFGQAVRMATGRPPWVLKATATVAVFAFIVPVIAAVLLLVAAGLITALAWTVFTVIGRVLDALTGRGRQTHASAQGAGHAAAPNDGRENVRVINR